MPEDGSGRGDVPLSFHLVRPVAGDVAAVLVPCASLSPPLYDVVPRRAQEAAMASPMRRTPSA